MQAPGDTLLVSPVPGAREALTTGHKLYAAEIAVTNLTERLNRDQPTAVRAHYTEKIAAAVRRRNALDAEYAMALARVQDAAPATAERIEDTVWRSNLVTGEDA